MLKSITLQCKQYTDWQKNAFWPDGKYICHERTEVGVTQLFVTAWVVKIHNQPCIVDISIYKCRKIPQKFRE